MLICGHVLTNLLIKINNMILSSEIECQLLHKKTMNNCIVTISANQWNGSKSLPALVLDFDRNIVLTLRGWWHRKHMNLNICGLSFFKIYLMLKESCLFLLYFGHLYIFIECPQNMPTSQKPTSKPLY